MIIRKPYAFLIRNFKKIHILLLLLSLFVAYKIFDVSNFVNDFMQFGIYDVYTNPITKHISLGLEISIILLLIGSAAILFLLRYKQKQWKLYLIPIAEYAVLIFVLNMIKGIFNMYNTTIKTTDVRLSSGAGFVVFLFLKCFLRRETARLIKRIVFCAVLSFPALFFLFLLFLSEIASISP